MSSGLIEVSYAPSFVRAMKKLEPALQEEIHEKIAIESNNEINSVGQ